jgi:transcriptional regulator with XRE-family HTH domain
MGGMSTLGIMAPNVALRQARLALRLSQDEMALAIRDAGQRLGTPNGCTKRLVQRWEAGEVALPRAVYIRALEYLTGRPVASLGFDTAAERYGLDPEEVLTTGSGPWIPLADPKAKPGPLTGIWLSGYDYESTGRGATFTSHHYVAVVQHGARLQVRSMPGSRSRLLMDLTANGQVLTGTWTEETNAAGYYQGAVYHGAIQFLLQPTGRKMTGKWVGFGRDFDLNTGPWSLELVTRSVTDETMKEYGRPVDGD